MTDKKRDPLPEGYRFGDVAPSHVHRVARFDVVTLMARCRCGAVCDVHAHPRADQWNVIEGETFASDADRHPVIEGYIVNRDLGDEA